jgi:hypothetical protein
MQPLYTMPVPPVETSSDYAYYQAFVHQMNRITIPMIAPKLRQAIELTANAMNTSPAHVARLLVDYGLRAPQHAFPDSFVDYVESRPQPKMAILRAAQDIDVMQLKDFWQALTPSLVQERILEAV